MGAVARLRERFTAAALLIIVNDVLEEADRRTAAGRKARALRPVERRLERAARAFFRAQRGAFLKRFAAYRWAFPNAVPGRARALREALNDDDVGAVWEVVAAEEATAVFAAAIEEAAGAALLAGGAQATAALGIEAAFGLEHPAAVAYLREYGAARVAGINAATRAELRRIVTEAVAQGWSYQKTAKAIATKFDDFSRARAQLIAVTEAGEAYEAAGLAAARDLAATGVALEKAWLTAGDSRVDDPICRPNGSQGWIGLEGSFTSGHERPLGHPGCRCTLLTRREPVTRGKGGTP